MLVCGHFLLVSRIQTNPFNSQILFFLSLPSYILTSCSTLSQTTHLGVLLVANSEASKWSCIYLTSLETFGLAAHLLYHDKKMREIFSFTKSGNLSILFTAHTICPWSLASTWPQEWFSDGLLNDFGRLISSGHAGQVLMAMLNPQIRISHCRDYLNGRVPFTGPNV